MRDTAHGCRYRPDLGLIRAAFNGHGRGMWAAYIAEVCARCLRFARRNTQIACGLRTPFLDYFVVPPSIQRPRTSAPQAPRKPSRCSARWETEACPGRPEPVTVCE